MDTGDGPRAADADGILGGPDEGGTARPLLVAACLRLSLLKPLVERCGAIEAQIARVKPRIPAIHDAYVEKLVARLKDAGLDPDAERLKQELALFATKIDVAEEVSRLSAHVAEVRRVLDQGGSSGKRLDFLMQELKYIFLWATMICG